MDILIGILFGSGLGFLTQINLSDQDNLNQILFAVIIYGFIGGIFGLFFKYLIFDLSTYFLVYIYIFCFIKLFIFNIKNLNF